MKYIIMIFITLLLFSLYTKSKNLKKIKLSLILYLCISIFYSLDSNTITVKNKKYLYGASDFETYASQAQATMKTNGVYASLTLAQAALEQGLKVPSTKNLFGIKADSSWEGKTALLQTKECNSSGCYQTMAAFRVYETVEGSFTDHGDWLLNRFGNKAAFSSATTLKDQLISLKSNPKAQYATDPNYLCSLSNIINTYDLTKYDEGITYEGRGITITGEHIENFTIDNCASVSSNSNVFNSILNYNPGTTYTGNIEDGYLFRLMNTGIRHEDELLDDLKNGYADSILKQIYERAIEGFGYGATSYDTNIAEVGGVDAGPYSTWKQYDARWGSIPLGSSVYNIKSSGCAATSVAIQISRSGARLSEEFTSILNPGSFVSFLNAKGGFTNGGSIVWGKASTVAPSFQYQNQIKVNESNILGIISDYLSSGNYYLIAHLKGSKRNNTTNHWVAVTGVSSNDIYMIDPGREGTSLEYSYGISNVDRITIYMVG